jgi:hypothetical protein
MQWAGESLMPPAPQPQAHRFHDSNMIPWSMIHGILSAWCVITTMQIPAVVVVIVDMASIDLSILDFDWEERGYSSAPHKTHSVVDDVFLYPGRNIYTRHTTQKGSFKKSSSAYLFEISQQTVVESISYYSTTWLWSLLRFPVVDDGYSCRCLTRTTDRGERFFGDLRWST